MSDAAPHRLALGGLVTIGAACVAMTFAAMRAAPVSDNLFLAIVTTQALLSVAAARLATRMPPAHALILLALGAIAIRLVLLSDGPLLSTDVYRYIWDGRILNAGFNPYLHVPADPALESLRDDAVWASVDKKDYAVTIYPPVAQAIFAVVTRIADGVQPMRLAMVGFEALGVAAMAVLCRRLAIHPGALALYLWHPFAAWEIANSGHVDAAMIGILLAGMAWGGYGRPYRTATAFAAAALVKPFGALFLPSVWRPFDLRLPLFVLAFVAVCYLPLVVAGGGVLGFLGIYLKEQGLDTGTGFYFVLLALKAGAPAWISNAYVGASLLLLFGLALVLAMRPDRDLKRRLGEAGALSITFMFLLTPVYPWYFLIVAPFAVLCRSWCAFAMMTTGFWLYGFNPDQIEFLYRWSGAVALVTLAGAFDLWTWRSGIRRAALRIEARRSVDA